MLDFLPDGLLSLVEADLTVAEICRRHDLSDGFIRNEIKEGRLPAYRFGKGDRAPLRISHASYLSWLANYVLEPKPKGAW